ncbi:MAG: GAF domain-containing protein [Candidatus Abyssobacteria bacterium SURF_5]|uniref:histidine kinase n=1 Tax=Abyssobacteria bacterium (strain SURF_5) TaxID=2093360 RepID=A0A3A4NAX1_ABYX5|nr:MAG: GAF domain-containing protein [Candidatus Abyssubacteria bacterium SURF_5]
MLYTMLLRAISVLSFRTFTQGVRELERFHHRIETTTLPIPEELNKRKRIILGELRERTLWFISLRWWVPPSIAAACAAGSLAKVQFAALPVLAVALFILAYNGLFYAHSKLMQQQLEWQPELVQRFTHCQVALDYTAMFLLIHFTGGASSPLIFFFIFHIIFASILLRPLTAYGFASLAAVGMTIISAAEYQGWLRQYPVIYRENFINLIDSPFHLLVTLGFFSMSVFITAFLTTAIMIMLRKRIVSLAELSERLTDLNKKLNSLYMMTQTILSTPRLDQVLGKVVTELAQVMNVQGSSVKLLSEDGKQLRYAAVHGLPVEWTNNKVVEVDKSPLNRRIIEGEPFVTGHATQREMFQFGEDLVAAQLQSVLFVPLMVEKRVTGILGAYCRLHDRFHEEDVEFFRQSAGLVAVALENARAYEAVEKLLRDRSWFMMRVAHNLRAPVSAIASILDVVRSGYLGELNPDQNEYLRRVDRRARTMLQIIEELMILATSSRQERALAFASIDVIELARRIRRTFQDEAAQKGLSFAVTVPDQAPAIRGDFEMIEQMLENLISNAIKYSPAGGNVNVVFSLTNNDTVRIEVSDNGIGIPKADMPRLFSEFFRAENARSIEEHGTGLGLAIVKEIVEQHEGRILVESEEGFGTIFVVHLPVARKEEKQ